MRNGLQVALDIKRMRTAVMTLLKASQTPDSIANLTTIAQVLSTYRPHRVGAVKMISEAPGRMVEFFQDLVDLPLYQELSHSVWAMGRVGKAGASATDVTQAARRLAEQQEALRFGRSAAFIPSERLHLSNSTAAEYLNLNYFPPIISFKKALDKARTNWKQLAPELVPVGTYPVTERFLVSRKNYPHSG